MLFPSTLLKVKGSLQDSVGTVGVAFIPSCDADVGDDIVDSAVCARCVLQCFDKVVFGCFACIHLWKTGTSQVN